MARRSRIRRAASRSAAPGARRRDRPEFRLPARHRAAGGLRRLPRGRPAQVPGQRGPGQRHGACLGVARPAVQAVGPPRQDARAAIATVCMMRYHFPFRMVLDTLDDATEASYVAEPDRLYVVGADGNVAWKSGLGPFYFDVESWYDAVKRELKKGV